MKYKKVINGTFVERINRFIALVKIDNVIETVHVKNTGRCRELLIQGAMVSLEQSDNPDRKTKYDLISVYKSEIGWVNIDSQAPNKAVKEWLDSKEYDIVRPEYTYGKSRIDFYMEREYKKYLMEVKGCTLEKNGIGYFPDAPTERGVKHLRELIQAQHAGYECSIAFVIQMNGINEVRPNIESHPEFGKALSDAKAEGVKVFFMTCKVTCDTLEVTGQIENEHI